LAFLPIVHPSQVASFEAFAFDYYAQHPELYPADVATHSFGRGIFAVSPLANSSDFAYHDTTGAVPWPAANQFLTPALQLAGAEYSQAEQNALLMYNARSMEEVVTTAQDKSIECVRQRVLANETCVYVTGMQGTNELLLYNPHTFVVQPIAAQDNNTVVGYVMGTLFFNDAMQDQIPEDTDGIDYVIEAGDLVLTYSIKQGVPLMVGTGDSHDRRFNSYRRTVDVLQGFIHSTDTLFASSTYTISFYPTERYISSFNSPLRWVFCFGSVSVIMLVTLLFVAYDYFMVRENTEQQAVLDTKRQFVRFISHEVRTPLNAVAMAGDLMREQLLDAIKKARTSEYASSSRAGATPPRTPRSGKGFVLEPTLEDSLELCEEIIGNTKNAVEVLDDLLNYDKIEVGGLSLDLTFVAMEHILDNVLKPFKGPAKQKEVTVEVSLDQYLRSSVFQNAGLFGGKFSVLRVVGDKVRLEQVIRNLISNALKFTPPLGKVVVALEWVDGGVEHAEFSPDVRHFLQVRSAASSTRRAEYTNKSRTMNSVTSQAPADIECGPMSPDDEAEEADETFHLQGEISRSVKEMEEFNRLTIIKSSFSRKPRDSFSNRQWGLLRLSVTDNGTGMSAEQLRAVCSEGVQFNANELQAGQGSGLGLFIAKGIVKQHGGQMTVTSEGLNQGSTFIVELPVYACDVFSPWENRILLQAKRDPVQYELHGVYGSCVSRPSSHYGSFQDDDCANSAKTELFAEEDRASVKGGSPAVKPLRTAPSAVSLDCSVSVSTEGRKIRRVLVVDDVASNRKMVIRLLQRSGVEVCEQAGDGQEAVNTFLAARQAAFVEATQLHLQSLEAQRLVGLVSSTVPKPCLVTTDPFDAVLMDFEMPVLNGPGATRKLRELGCTVPIVGISGNVLPADVQLFVEHGANAVLPKPLNFMELERIWSGK